MNVFGKAGRRGRGRGRDRNRTTRIGLELFEQRTLLSQVAIVTNTSGDPTVSGSLGFELNYAQGHFTAANPGTIEFNIPAGPFVISPTATLDVPANTTVDGSTEAAFLGSPAVIQINGGNQSIDGLTVVGTKSTINDLEIVDFKGAGIRVESTAATITANLIGTDGTPAANTLGNQVGIWVDGSAGAATAVIGGATPALANTIGFNSSAGVSISGAGATGTTVLGNDIGTDATGDNLGNLVGVSIAASNNIIGQAGAGNTIGHNTTDGISVTSGTGNVISQNIYVGLNGTGSPVQANDIALAGGVTNPQSPPKILTASYDPSYSTPLVVQVEATPVTSSSPQTLEVYKVTAAGRTLVATKPVTGLSASSPTAVSLSLVQGATLSGTENLVATLTDSVGGTSEFSGSVGISSGSVVTTAADDGPGSLHSAINFATANPNTRITFAIPGTGPFNINLTTALPVIPSKTTIDGTSSTGGLVILNGGNTLATGLALAGGSDEILKLEVENFTTGILISSSGNTVGGTAGTGNTIGPNGKYGVDVNSGGGNVVSEDTYVGSNGTASPIQANDIFLGAGVTNPQAAPTLAGPSFDPQTNQLTVEAYANGPTSAQQVLEIYLVTAGQRTFVSSQMVQLSTNSASPTSVTFNLSPSQVTGITTGSSFAATLTDPTKGTSTFSAAVTIQGGNVVTQPIDSKQYGSLYYAINYVTQNSGYKNIVFDIPVASTATSVTLDESGVTLPPIPVGITIDGSTEAQNVNQTVSVIIDGKSQAKDGLTLSGGQDRLLNLTIENFKNGVVVSSGGNTVADSTIGPNSQSGIDIISGSGSVVTQGTYEGSNGTGTPVQANDIVVGPGVTNPQSPPTLLTASFDSSYATPLVVQVEATPVPSSSPQTLEVYTVTAASRKLVATAQVTGLSSSSPTAVYLSLVPGATLNGTENLAATLTDSVGGTSEFSGSVPISLGSVVTTKADDGPGSLRSAINFAANHSGTKITFAIPAPNPSTGTFVIPVGSSSGAALPALPAGTIVDGSTEAGIVLTNAGAGNNADGLTLPNGNDKVLGLTIQGFNVGILVDSSSNTIGGTGSSAGNTIGPNGQYSVDVKSGSGNVVSQDTYVGSNGTASPVQANDIFLGAGVTKPQPAPVLLSATLGSSSNTVILQTKDPVTSNLTVEVYVVTNGSRTFVGAAKGDPNSPSPFTSVTTTASLSPGQVLAATFTDATNGTSIFSDAVTIAGGNVVNTTNDSGAAGSLSYAINYVANPANKTTNIVFAVTVPQGQTSVTLNESGGLPPIPANITIDGATESTNFGQSIRVIIDGGTKAINGLTLSGGDIIENLTIQNFAGTGIVVASSGNVIAGDTVQNNKVGVSITGSNNLVGEFGLQLKSWGDGSNVPTKGQDLVIAGLDSSGLLHIRTFDPAGVLTNAYETVENGDLYLTIADASGAVLQSTQETKLSAAVGLAISDLKLNLPNWLPPHVLSGTETSQALGDATLITGKLLQGSGNTIVNNTVGGSTAAGIQISGNNDSVNGNYIGTDAAGKDQGNTVGISITGTSDTIGGTVTGGAAAIVTASSYFGPSNILGYNGTGISISGAASDLVVQGNFIGTDLAGTKLATGSEFGISVDGVSGLTIGGSNTSSYSSPTSATPSLTSFEGNVIGYVGTGISISGNAGDNVEGNYIGVDPINPKIDLGNGTGILLSSSSNIVGGSDLVDSVTLPLSGSTLGATVTSSANIIGFNTKAGVKITSDSNKVQANYIGTEPGGYNLGNADGIDLSGSGGTGNTIGGTLSPTIGGTGEAALSIAAATNGNIIAFSTGDGVKVEAGASSNTIGGNYIGTDPSGDALGNSNGIEITGGTSITIGSSSSGIVSGSPENGANIISGNANDGILLDNSASNNSVEGNMIGADSVVNAGTAKDTTFRFGNGNGIEVNSGASDNTIGGSPNIGQTGAVSTVGTTANLIAGNSADGILFGPASGGPGKTNTVVGNVISLNSHNGIDVAANASPTSNTIIQGNLIGIDPSNGNPYNSLNQSEGNLLSGIQIAGNNQATISQNVISGNGLSGITLSSTSGAGEGSVQIRTNLIGTDVTGTEVATSAATGALPFGNVLDGIRVADFTGVTIGGTAPANTVDLNLTASGGNLISGNLGRGIELDGGASGVAIDANLIGVLYGAQWYGLQLLSWGDGSTVPSAGQSIVLVGLDSGGLLHIRAFDPAGVRTDTYEKMESNSLHLITADASGNILSDTPESNLSLVQTQAIASLKQEISDLLALRTLTVPQTYQILGEAAAVAGRMLYSPEYSALSSQDALGNSSGNLSDGVFVYQATGNSITGDVISANRGYGVHVFGNQLAQSLTISSNFIGTNQDGTQVVVADTSTGFGNGADGIFLDQVGASGSPSPTVQITGNVVSGNHANGVDLQNSDGVTIASNKIGTSVDGSGAPGVVDMDFGNGSNGVFISLNSQYNTVGGTSAVSNVISGNHGSGVFVSGSSGSVARFNVIAGNYIGYSPAGLVPNAVAGIILSNASSNTIGGAAGTGNVISGNSLDGILLVNTAESNSIEGNLIGTDTTGTAAVPNSADGILLLGGSIGTTIKGVTQGGGPVDHNEIIGNVVSGNSENGIQIFGAYAKSNQVLGNTIGLAKGGSAMLGNQGNGVYLNNDGGNNVIDGGSNVNWQVGDPNVISGNAQSGILIFGTAGQGGHDEIAGNLIGVDSGGMNAMPNGGDGVFIYGTPNNSVTGNIISGNAQAGVQIFTPVDNASAEDNTVSGNYIGVGAQGTNPIGNASDGVQIFSASHNIIGPGNVISENRGNGILIAEVSTSHPIGNTIQGNLIGVGSDGSTARGNLQDGILVNGGWNNTIGAVGTSVSPTSVASAPTVPSNVISGNGAAGVEFAGATSRNTLLGNYIGVATNGTQAVPNTSSGVFIDNLSTQASREQIGLPEAGAGNIIGGSSTNPAVNILGPATGGFAQNTVQGNLIGVGSDNQSLGDQTGVLLQNSAGNTIGGPGAGMNVISGNTQAGVELTGLFSTQELIQYNDIGTRIDGTGRVGQQASNPIDDGTYPVQKYGVYILTPSPSSADLPQNNLISWNKISGNLIGINITGVGSDVGTGQNVPLGKNVITNNKIGTDASGNPDPNFEYGVYINNSAANTIGGSTAAGNLLAYNGVDGVEIFAGVTRSKSGAPSARNIISGNTIGLPPATGNPPVTVVVPDGPTITLGQQLYGVVVIGSSSNQIGTKSVGNTIRGNVQAGVYITVKDFQGNVYATPTNNTLNDNQIIANGVYGVYRFESPDNSVPMRPQRHPNIFRGNPVPLGDYIKTLNSNTQLPRTPSKYARHHHGKSVKIAKHPFAGHHGRGAHPARLSGHHGKVAGIARPSAHEADAGAGAGAQQSVRPRVPALFRDGVDPLVIGHNKRHHGH